MRYLSQRIAAPDNRIKAILTDIGTEELAHLEMVCAIVHQLTRNMTPEEIKKSGFDAYFVNHTAGLYPTDANGSPFKAETFASTGDLLADLYEDMAADGTTVQEQRG